MLKSWKSYLAGFVSALVLVGAAVGGVIVAPALASSPASSTDATQIADQFGVTVVWSTVPCSLMDPTAEGCFLANTPSTVYVSAGLSALRTRYAVLHEVGHVMQHRLGESISECGADQFAQSLGARFGHYC